VSEAAPGTSVAGSAFYMAPEQYLGRPCQASDIFALGVIAYEMLTGRRPFSPPTQYTIIESIRAGVRISPQDLRPAIPDQAQDLILKALSYEPECRPQRARDFGEQIAEALTSEAMAATKCDPSAEPDLEVAHVLCIQIAGFGSLPTETQSSTLKRVQQIVNGADSFKKAKSAGQLISRSAGDRFALIFFSSPKAAAECAAEIARAIKPHSEIKLRMGINTGPIYRLKDLNQAGDATGAGINIAQQVMACGDAGHILVSKSSADLLAEAGGWRERLHDIGTHKIESGAAVHLFNLYDPDVGNPARPRALRGRSGLAKLVGAAAFLILGLVIVLKVVLSSGPPPPPIPGPGPGPSPGPVALPEHALSYSLTVQKYQGNRKDGSPFTLADANQIFESKYHVKLNVVTPQPGYFYVLNEGPPEQGSTPRFNMLYPASADQGKGSETRITAPAPADEWFEFDNKRGTEKLWLVWSDKPVPQLEAVKALANQTESQIRDSGQSDAVRDLLNQHKSSKLEKVTDEDAKQTTIKGTEAILVYPLNLEHQ